MANFAGKWKMESSENFDEYMKVLGVGMVLRKMASTATPTTEITVDGDSFYIKTSTTFKTTEIKFTLGVEFEETTGDGRKVKSTVTAEADNKLIHKQVGEPADSTIIRELLDGKMVMDLIVMDGDKEVICKRVYKKVD